MKMKAFLRRVFLRFLVFVVVIIAIGTFAFLSLNLPSDMNFLVRIIIIVGLMYGVFLLLRVGVYRVAKLMGMSDEEWKTNFGLKANFERAMRSGERSKNYNSTARTYNPEADNSWKERQDRDREMGR